MQCFIEDCLGTAPFYAVIDNISMVLCENDAKNAELQGYLVKRIDAVAVGHA